MKKKNQGKKKIVSEHCKAIPPFSPGRRQAAKPKNQKSTTEIKPPATRENPQGQVLIYLY